MAGDTSLWAVGVLSLVLSLHASPALSEQTLYCTDTDATGFKWEKAEERRLANFKLARFTVKIESESGRTIVQTSEGDVAGLHFYYT